MIVPIGILKAPLFNNRLTDSVEVYADSHTETVFLFPLDQEDVEISVHYSNIDLLIQFLQEAKEEIDNGNTVFKV